MIHTYYTSTSCSQLLSFDSSFPNPSISTSTLSPSLDSYSTPYITPQAQTLAHLSTPHSTLLTYTQWVSLERCSRRAMGKTSPQREMRSRLNTPAISTTRKPPITILGGNSKRSRTHKAAIVDSALTQNLLLQRFDSTTGRGAFKTRIGVGAVIRGQSDRVII